MDEKIKILLIPGFLVYPAYTGGAVAQTCFLKEYCKNFETHIILTEQNVIPERLEEFIDEYSDLKVHYIGLKSQSTQKFNQKRMVFIILKTLIGKLISKFRNNEIQENELIAPLSPASSHFVNGLSSVLNQFSFDIVQVEVFLNLAITPLLTSRSVNIFVSQETQFMRIQSQIEAWKKAKCNYENYLKDYQTTFEMSFMQKYDALIVYSEEEAKRHEEYFNLPIRISPFTVFDRTIPEKSEYPIKLVFLGAESHYPNKEGIEWLLNEASGSLNKIGLPIYIVGNWSNATQKEWKKKYNIIFAGIVDNLDEFLADGILLAPIRFGGGLKTKVMDALKLGVPVIATTHATEGLPVENDKHLIIIDSAHGFVEGVNRIKNDRELTSKFTTNSMNLMNNEFSASNLGILRIKVIKEIYYKIRENK
jgi:glycosyltransferase involved in cell wall biosynthesis